MCPNSVVSLMNSLRAFSSTFLSLLCGCVGLRLSVCANRCERARGTKGVVSFPFSAPPKTGSLKQFLVDRHWDRHAGDCCPRNKVERQPQRKKHNRLPMLKVFTFYCNILRVLHTANRHGRQGRTFKNCTPKASRQAEKHRGLEEGRRRVQKLTTPPKR